MANADTNRVYLAFQEESTWGTAPATLFEDLRITGESLNVASVFESSKEIRDDRQITDSVRTDKKITGGFDFELSYGPFDDLLEGALWSDWSTPLSISLATIALDDSPANIIGPNAAAFADIAAGMWIKVAGCTTAANDGFYFVSSKSGATLSVIPAPNTADVAGPTISITGSYLRNGTTEHSYSIERGHTDIAQYFLFTGMVCNSLKLSIQAASMITGSFDFIGADVALSASPASSTAYTAASSNAVMNAMSNVGSIYEGSTLAALAANTFLQSIELNVANNVRGRKAVGTTGNADIGVGACDVTGSLTAYFKDATLFTKHNADTETGLSFRLTDNSSNVYIITIPRITFEDDKINAGSANQDVMENIAWRGLRHETYDYTIQISKF